MITLENISKSYRLKKQPINALQNIQLDVKMGEFLVIRGPSGSGKTTLLLTLGGMLHPSSGIIRVNGQDIFALSESERTRFRSENIGFVFQMFHLLPYLTVLENILLPTGCRNSSAAREQALVLLKKMGLEHRQAHDPASLSAGERQRTAIARALINHPKIILADEPTGNLDPENAAAVMQHLSEFQNRGGTVIMVTHGSEAESFADRILVLKNGKLVN